MVLNVITTERTADGEEKTTVQQAVTLPDVGVRGLIGFMDLNWDAQVRISALLADPALPPDARRVIVSGLESITLRGGF